MNGFGFGSRNVPVAPSIFTWAFRSRQLRTEVVEAKAANINVTVPSLSSSPPIPYTPRICPFRRTNFVLTPGTGRFATWTRPLCKLPGFRNVFHLGPGKGTRYASFQSTFYSQSKTGTTHQPDHILERERGRRSGPLALIMANEKAANLGMREKELACPLLTGSN